MNKIQLLSFSKLSKLLNPNIAEKLIDQHGIFAPTCPIGSFVYRYSPVEQRVLKYTIIDIKFNSDECSYNAECYEYAKFTEAEIGVRFYISRSGAKNNHNVLDDDEINVIKKLLKTYSTGMSLVNKNNFCYFKTNERLISLNQGLKKLSMLDESPELIKIIKRQKEHIDL